jgi:hypothetical protein
MVARALAEQALGYAVAGPYYLMLFLALEIVVPGVVAAPAAVTPRRGPSTLRRCVVVANFVAP